MEQMVCEINKFEYAMRHLSASPSIKRDNADKSSKHTSEETEKRLIDGNYAKSNKVIARCYSSLHRGYLTKGLIKKHKCIEKKCTSFAKANDAYWRALRTQKESEENKRLEAKKTKKQIAARDAFIRETLEKSGHIHVTSICQTKYNALSISYIYDRKVKLSSEVKQLCDKLEYKINMQPRVGTDEAIETLIRKPRRESGNVTDLCKAPKVGEATKKRLNAMGIYCIEDLLGRNGSQLYKMDCELTSEKVNRLYLTAYQSAVEYSTTLP